MVPLGELVRIAGASLRPRIPFDAARSVTGVHVSELDDPGRYLEGGELLLTTGIPLRTQSPAEYVRRLAGHSVGALGIGLGEGLHSAPRALIDQCTASGIPVFEVPDGAPFLDVSRAYWSIAGQREAAESKRTAHDHTRLALAASGPDPVAAVVRAMSQSTGGWVAWVPFGSSLAPEMLHPTSLVGMLPAVRADIETSLVRPGVEAASFTSHGSVVFAYAVADGERTRGALALGAGRPLSRADRQLALTAVVLLRLLMTRARPRMSTAGHWIAELAVRGDAAAARALAAAAGFAVPAVLRVLVGSTEIDPSGLVVDRDDVRIALLAASEATTVERGALSREVTLEEVPAAVARTMALHRRSPAHVMIVESVSRARTWAELLATDHDLLRTVTSYLRNRHQAERTARELGVHRNTVRPRVLAAEHLLGVSLDDPDVVAELWLELRDREL